MAHVWGVATILLNGQAIESKEGASLNLGGKERTPVMGSRGVIGWTEKIVNSTLTCTLAHTAAQSLVELGAFVDGVIRVQGDNGKAYVIEHAFATKPPSLSDGGDVPLEFAGDPAKEVEG